MCMAITLLVFCGNESTFQNCQGKFFLSKDIVNWRQQEVAFLAGPEFLLFVLVVELEEKDVVVEACEVGCILGLGTLLHCF